MSVEAGIRPQRSEFVREGTRAGGPGTDPSWLAYSDAVREARFTLGGNDDLQRIIGTVDPQNVFLLPEDDEFEVDYDLQVQDAGGTAHLFEDNNGDPLNAVTDGLLRNADNEILNTHASLFREEHNLGGVDGGGVRLYLKAYGAYPGTITIPGDPESSPIMVTIGYTCALLRAFVCHQPSSSTTLDVESTDTSDTTQVLTLEDDGASTSEDVTLNGTTTQTTTGSFGSIDAFYLDSETKGDVLIKDGSGNTLATIHGTDSYQGARGDLGVWPLGSGSRATALSGDYVTFQGSLVERPAGTTLAEKFHSLELTVENNVSSVARDGTIEMDIKGENRDITMSATEFGETRGHQTLREHARRAQDNIKWDFGANKSWSEHILTLNNAYYESPGELVKETGSGRAEMGSTYRADGIAISSS